MKFIDFSCHEYLNDPSESLMIGNIVLKELYFSAKKTDHWFVNQLLQEYGLLNVKYFRNDQEHGYY